MNLEGNSNGNCCWFIRYLSKCLQDSWKGFKKIHRYSRYLTFHVVCGRILITINHTKTMNSSWIRTEKNSYLIPKIRTCLVTTYVLQGYLQDSCSRYKFILGNKRWVGGVLTKIRVFGSNIAWFFYHLIWKKLHYLFWHCEFFHPKTTFLKYLCRK